MRLTTAESGPNNGVHFIMRTPRPIPTPATQAVRGAHMRRGADPDTPASFGDTPLLLAVWDLGVDAVSSLLRHGANVHIRDNNGRSALSEARQRRGGAEILELVEAAAARCGSSVNDIPLHS